MSSDESEQTTRMRRLSETAVNAHVISALSGVVAHIIYAVFSTGFIELFLPF